MTTMKSSGEHRRGRSMGSVIPQAPRRAGEKDEDLALFHEMKRREKHNFLHPSPDDLDATLSSKFGGMGAPTKKPGTDLLTSESDKNDYDWLLTPPGTPLFPSLDQEAAALAVLSPALSNGSYSSASSATKSLKSSTYSPAAESVSKGNIRGNPSPRRQGGSTASTTTPNGISRSRSSPSTAATLTRPSTPTTASGTRPSTPTSKPSTPSVRASTPNLKLTISNSSKSYSTATTPSGTRPSTPSGTRPSTPTARPSTPRSSTPTARPSTPGGRSSTPTSKPSTPTMRRSLSGGRTALTSPAVTSSRGGPSPNRTNSSSSRGSSPSAKRAPSSVITSIAGMSSEAPPNLRTTMSDRPTSAGKGMNSNGSRAGSESGHNNNNVDENRRRPRSPSVARSFSSSSSQDQRTSSQTSRGSVISAYDDGLEVNRPSSMGNGRNSSSAGKWHAAGHEELLMNGKANPYVKRVSKPSVGSKETTGYMIAHSRRSSDPVKRPVDAYQNSPTSAYKHLHSSSPVSPFYSTRSNSMLLRASSAMNSSVTTSSNASSEQGTTVAADTEGSERDEDDLLSWDSYGRRASSSPRLQQADILVLDKEDEKMGGLWQDSLYERANSHEPSSSHSQGSQSTLDAEVSGFYETDGIASLEMLEQLGLMGENYKLKKSSTFGGRASEKRSSSTDDSKVPNLPLDEVAQPKIISPHRSPHRMFQEGLRSPHRSPGRIFQEGGHRSPHMSPHMSPHRVFQERQATPARQGSQSPQPHRVFQERQATPARQGSQSPQLERRERESSDRLRKSRDFETELLKRNMEKQSVGLPEPKVHNSEIRAACLFVRDFKVGLSPHHSQDAPVFAKDSPAGSRRHGIDEMEMKLRNELSYDWDNSVDLADVPKEGKLSDSPILVPLSKKHIATLDHAPRLNLEDSFIPAAAAAAAVYHTKIDDSLDTPASSKNVGLNKPELTLPKDVDSEHPISMNGTPTSAAVDNSRVQNGVMDESKTESTLPRDVHLDSPVPLEHSGPSAVSDSTSVLEKAANEDASLDIQSSLSDGGDYGVDEHVPKVHALGSAATVHGHEEESELLEFLEGGHMHAEEEPDNSPVDVDEVRTLEPEDHKEDTHGGTDETEFLQAETKQEVAQEEGLDGGLQYSEPDDVQDVADEGLHGVQHSDAEDNADNEHVVEDEEHDGIRFSDVDNQKNGMQFSNGEVGHEVAHDEVVPEEDERDIVPVEGDKLQVLDREIEQSPHIHSNGNHNLFDSEYPGALEKEALPNHDNMEGFPGRVTAEEQSPEMLQGLSDKESVVDLEERSSPETSHAHPDEIAEEESALNESYETAGVDSVQKDVLRDGGAGEGTQNLEVEPLQMSTSEATTADNGAQTDVFRSGATGEGAQNPEALDMIPSEVSGEGARRCLSDSQIQEESQSQSLEYFDANSVETVDDVGGEEVSSGMGHHHLVQEGIQTLKYCNSDSVKEYDYLEVASREDGDLHQKNLSFLSSRVVKEAPKQDIKLSPTRHPEFSARCVENQQTPNGNVESKPKSPARFFEKHTEVLEQSRKSADTSEIQSPPRAEFRSASTLCAALEEQIAGLIQKIDSAIEESSKPFSISSPQDSLLSKDKRSTFSSELSRELEQDDSAGSIRSSQEEDLLDMLWAEDDESSCSEGSRDHDLINSKDDSQREMNGVRSSRLSDRGLPVSLLGQSNDSYDAVVRSSRSDLGVEKEKHMLEEPFKKSPVRSLDQQEDGVRTPIPVGSPVLHSTEITTHHLGIHEVPEDALFPPDTTHESTSTDIPSNGNIEEYGVLMKSDEDLCTIRCDQEYASDSLTESSSGDEGDDMKTDEELLSLCRSGQQTGDGDSLTKTSLPEGSSDLEVGPVAEERLEQKATTLKESTQEGGGSPEAAPVPLPMKDVAMGFLSPLLTMSGITSNGNGETAEARDLAFQELAHNGDREEPPILLTLARSDLSSSAANEAPKEEWMHRKGNWPDEPSSRSVTSLGHVAEKEVPDSKLYDKEPQSSLEEQGVWQETIDSPSHSTESELVDSRKQEEDPQLDEKEAQDKSSVLSDHDSLSLSDAGFEHVHESGETQNLEEEPISPQHEVSVSQGSFSTGAEQEPEKPTATGTEDERTMMPDTTQGTALSTDVIDSTELPESDPAGHGHQNMKTAVDADDVGGEDLISADESQQASPQRHHIAPLAAVAAADHSAVKDGIENGTQSEGAQVVQETMMLQQHPESSPVASSNGLGEEAQIQKWKSDQRPKSFRKGQDISVIAGSKISSTSRVSFRVEENDAGAELGRQHSAVSSDMVPTTTTTTVREDGSTEAHESEEVEPPKEQNHSEREWSAESPATGHQEATRLSVWSELPVVDFHPVRRPAGGNEEMEVSSDILSPDANGNGDFATREDKGSGAGNQSVKRLPSNKAKSVRTISFSPIPQIESPTEEQEPGSPDGEVHTPKKSNSYTNITVISPDSLQWDQSSPADETPTKLKTSPASLARSMTLAEATDTILYCSSLMHTIVYKAAAYAIEKEELAALASTPTTNGEVPHGPDLSSEVDNTREENNDSGVGEEGKWKAQGVSNGPPPVRRALSYMGHQTVPLAPADTSLQIPVDQVIENGKSPETAAHTAIQVREKGAIIPVKASKSKCGCSIM